MIVLLLRATQVAVERECIPIHVVEGELTRPPGGIAYAGSILTLTVMLYLLAATRAIGLRRRERVVTIAFSLFGSGYLFLVTCNEFHTIEQSLVTNYPLAMMASAKGLAPILSSSSSAGVNPLMARYAGSGISNSQSTSSSSSTTPSTDRPLDQVILMAATNSNQTLSRLFLIGHCVWSWIIALFGAWLCGYTYSKRKVPESQ